jgi:hypothetical protein
MRYPSLWFDVGGDPPQIYIEGIHLEPVIVDEDLPAWDDAQRRERMSGTDLVEESKLLGLPGGARALEEWTARDFSRRQRITTVREVKDDAIVEEAERMALAGLSDDRWEILTRRTEPIAREIADRITLAAIDLHRIDLDTRIDDASLARKIQALAEAVRALIMGD